MKLILKIVTAIIIFTLCAFVFVGCNDKDASVVKVNEVTHSVFYAPFYVAIANGYFEEEGLTIELTNGGGSDKSMTAVMSGQADIGLMGPETAVYVKLAGSNNYPKVFAQLTQKDGSFLIGRTPQNDFSWSSLQGAEIIGGRPGGMPAMCLEYALYKNGLVDGENVTINYDVQFDLITASFESGIGDYCTMFEPNATQYQNNGKGYSITSVGAEAGKVPYTCFMATQSYINDNPKTVESFMRAVIKGIDFVMESDDLTVANALISSFPGTDVQTLASSVKAYKAIDSWKASPVMSEEDFNTLLDILEFAEVIEERVAFSDIIDNSIAQSIAK